MLILLIHILTDFSVALVQIAKDQPELRVVHVRDLNFVLRSEIFVHSDRQIRVSHLILGIDLVYTT